MATGHLIETFLIVIDAAGWSLKLASFDAFKYLKGIADIDSAHYPERLGAIVIVNAPAALDFAWRAIRVWLDARTKAKITILRKGGYAALQVLIDSDQIPSDYGGTGPTLCDGGVEKVPLSQP